MLLEERLVLVDRADVIARLQERRRGGADRERVGTTSLEDALECLIGRRGEREHLGAGRFDVLARVMARKVRKPVDRALPRPAEPGEDKRQEIQAMLLPSTLAPAGDVSLPGHPHYPGAGDDLAIRTLNREAGLHIDSNTARCRWQGETMDYSMAIEGMYCLEEHARKLAGAAEPSTIGS